jgi:hypothetical protein
MEDAEREYKSTKAVASIATQLQYTSDY